jgi:hypothetical protein
LEQGRADIHHPKCCRALTLLEIAGGMDLARVDNAEAASGDSIVCASVVVFPRKIHAEAQLIRFVYVLGQRFRRTRSVKVQFKEHSLM